MLTRFQPIGCCALLCSLCLVACGDSGQKSGADSGDNSLDADAHNHDHNHGVNAIQPGVWPPTLVGIENEQAVPEPIRTRGADVVIASARNTIRNNPVVRNLLGSNYSEYEASAGSTKDNTVASFLFYNFDNNTTVDVKLASDGSLGHTVYPATDYQPTENSDEVVEAIDLGGAALQAQGINISSLQGSAMLAFRPAQDNPAAEQYYSQRVLYVTFGPGNGIEPEYWALVNLSQQSVMDSGEVL